MGIEKEKHEAGYRSISGTVCSDCFGDYGIKDFIENNSNSNECSYCGNSGTDIKACAFEKVVVHILDSIKCEWGDPSNEGVGWESREGGWLGANVNDTYDLIYDELGIEVEYEEILDDLNSSIIMGPWCRKDPYSSDENERLISAWNNFSELVKHNSRYVFFKKVDNNSPYDEMDPVEILNSLSEIITRLDLVKRIDQNVDIYRVRVVDEGKELKSAKDLGSPPKDKALLANRMSPAGISMFYGSFDLETAISETYEPGIKDSKEIVCGTFNPARMLSVIDLSENIQIPSLFDETKREDRFLLKFLKDFIIDFSKPIERIDRAHVDYVPTQVVTEYIKHIFPHTRFGNEIDGIIYPSSKAKDQKCVVIFASSEQCEDTLSSSGGEMLVLKKVEIKKSNNANSHGTN